MKSSHLISCLGVVLSLLAMLSANRVSADPGILYVSATNPACGGQSPCFTTIQAAVNAAADGDEIRVAAGTYRGTTSGVVNGNTYVQVALITKSLTLQGGYTTANWTTPNPAANPTIIDAQRRGRGISIVGDGSQQVTVAGFTITNGDYTGRGNPPDVGNQVCARTGSDCGGGLFAYQATLVLRDCMLTNNVASREQPFSDGGGAYLWALNSGSRVENTTFRGNSTQGAQGEGGGMLVDFGGAITIANSRFEQNQADGEGGGLFIFQPADQVHIEDTAFIANQSNADGGALEARLTFDGTALRLDRVTMRNNVAGSQAAAISLIKQGSGTTTVEMTNVLLAANTLANAGASSAVIDAGSGTDFGDLVLSLKHPTFASHAGLGALRLTAIAARPMRATLVNALIDTAASAFIGNQLGGEVQLQHTNTLTNGVPTLHTTENGMPTFQALNPLTGNPRLNANYHLQTGSAAIDAGMNSGVPDDLDGDRRPMGAGYDIGADEYRPPGAK
jgi:hypothetical protein